MDSLARARGLVRGGLFSDAAECFEQLPKLRLDATATLEKAWILEHLGRADLAESLAHQVLRLRGIGDVERAHGQFILSRVAASRGLYSDEVQTLRKALTLADRAGHRPLSIWAQLRLLAALSNQAGPESCADLIRSLRHNVTCEGDPHLLAALHLVVADMDGKRGLIAKSQRHVRLARGLLDQWDNVWLRAWSFNTLAAIALVSSDFHAAHEHGSMALVLSRRCGSASLIRSSLGNLGQLQFTVGDLDSSVALLNEAVDCGPKVGEAYAGLLETMARVQLARGRVDESHNLLREVEGLVTATHQSRYVGRHSLLTKAEVLVRLGRPDDAAESLRRAIALANDSGDHLLDHAARMRLAELGAATADVEFSVLNTVSLVGFGVRTPDALARYERVVASRLLGSGSEGLAAIHLDRAKRIYSALGNIADLALMSGGTPITPPSSAQAIVQDLGAVLVHAGRPELVGSSLLSVLRQLPCIQGAAVRAVSPEQVEVLDGFGVAPEGAGARTIALGTSHGRAIELSVAAEPDLESQATVTSVSFIAAATLELERGRIEREERLTLWPVDELPAEDDDSVVTGKMRDLMIYARKVAQTSASVLVTGESGTGKEVLARAIHRYSPRAKKPFVPFNCTAVPRELLESQLFGYRRGSFTGADRDYPGLIRAARDGTLFLDEIGELGLDLQPKLLRFLESGEISPLGETTPSHVNVRVVAATNANLEQLVADGRFREDLYYRLNVIQLTLPPLRERRDEIPAFARNLAQKAAYEFGKGRMQVSDDLMAHLLVYPWPGNVRQLNNELRRMVVTADPDSTLTPDHLPRDLRDETEELIRKANGLEFAVPPTEGLDQTVARIEREMITAALRAHHGKVEAAAKALGISRKGLYLKRRRLGL